jgi:hypothetical protein
MHKTATSILVLALASAQVDAGTKTIVLPIYHLAFSYDDAVWVHGDSGLTMPGTGITLSIAELPHLGNVDNAEQLLNTFESDELLRPGVSQSISNKLEAVAHPAGWSCRSYERRREGISNPISLSRLCAVMDKDHYEILSIKVPADHVDRGAVVRLNRVIASIRHP